MKRKPSDSVPTTLKNTTLLSLIKLVEIRWHIRHRTHKKLRTVCAFYTATTTLWLTVWSKVSCPYFQILFFVNSHTRAPPFFFKKILIHCQKCLFLGLGPWLKKYLRRKKHRLWLSFSQSSLKFLLQSLVFYKSRYIGLLYNRADGEYFQLGSMPSV